MMQESEYNAKKGAGGTELSIVIPCLNEAAVFPELLRRVSAAAEQVELSYEIIIIDDGSIDETWKQILEASTRDARIVGVKLSRNFGHQVALTAGLRLVRGKFIFIIDADLQDPPELLSEMYSTMLRERADVVYGYRRTRSGEPVLKKAFITIFYRLLQFATNKTIPPEAGDFRLISRRMSDTLMAMPERDRFLRGMIAWVGFKQVAYEYDRKSRFLGKTKYPLRKLLRLAMDAFLGHSMVLLRVAGFMALLLFLALVGVAIFTLYAWFYLPNIPGWTSITMLVVLTSATQLLVLSVLGEYIGRIYMESKRRPLFIVEEATKKHDGN